MTVIDDENHELAVDSGGTINVYDYSTYELKYKLKGH